MSNRAGVTAAKVACKSPRQGNNLPNLITAFHSTQPALIAIAAAFSKADCQSGYSDRMRSLRCFEYAQDFLPASFWLWHTNHFRNLVHRLCLDLRSREALRTLRAGLLKARSSNEPSTLRNEIRLLNTELARKKKIVANLQQTVDLLFRYRVPRKLNTSESHAVR